MKLYLKCDLIFAGFIYSCFIIYLILSTLIEENFIKSLELSCNINNNFHFLGFGSMNVSNKVHLPSRFLYDLTITVVNDIGLKYPNYTDAVWVPWDYKTGHWPDHVETHDAGLFEIKNVVFTTECVIIRQDGYHLFKHECHPRYWSETVEGHKSNITYEKYDKVICIGHQHTHVWGHWLLEVFPCFFILPQSILDESYIALPCALPFIVNNLNIIGIESWRIIDGINKPYYANTFYTVTSRFCGDLNRFLIVNMKQKLAKILQLDKIKATKFAMYNRPPTQNRHILNFHELYKSAKTRFPNFDWIIYEEHTKIEEASKIFASFKLFFAVHCSILANELFMHPGSVVVEMQHEAWLLSFLFLGPMIGLYQIEGRDMNILYSNITGNKLNIAYSLKLIKVGLIKANLIKQK